MLAPALLMGFALVGAGAPAEAAAADARQQILPIWNRMQDAANAHDTDRFMAPFVRSPDLIFAVNGEVIRGFDALHARQLQWWNNGRSDARYTEDGSPRFMALGAGAEVSTASFTSRRTAPDGKARVGRFVVTYVWKKLPQGWRIIYGHESWARPSP